MECKLDVRYVLTEQVYKIIFLNSVSNTQDNNKKIVKNTMMLYVRMFLTMAVALYTSRVVLNTLGIDDYGIYNVVGGVVSVLAFFNSSMATSTQRFLNVEMGKGNYDSLNKVFINAVNSHYLIGIITVIALESVGLWFLYNKLNIPAERFASAIWVFHLSVASLFVSIISTPYNAAIIANERMSVYAYFSILDVFLRLVVVYLLLVVSFDKLVLYAILLLLVGLIMQSCYMIYCKKKFKECSYKWNWNFALIRKMFSFTGWMIFGCLTDMLGNQGVNILINMFFGPVYNAARGIAVQARTAVDSFVLNFLTAVKPQVMKSYSSGELEYMYKLVFSSSRLSYYLLLILTLPIFFNTHYILELWLKTVPPLCELFTQLTIVELLIRTAYTPIAYVNQASGKIRNYQISVSLLFILTFVLSYIVYKMGMPVYSSFVVAIIVAVIGLFVRMLVLKYDNDFPVMDYLKSVFSPIISVSIISSILPLVYCKFSNDNFVSFLIASLICVISSSITIWVIGLRNSEKQMVISKIQSIIRKQK